MSFPPDSPGAAAGAGDQKAARLGPVPASTAPSQFLGEGGGPQAAAAAGEAAAGEAAGSAAVAAAPVSAAAKAVFLAPLAPLLNYPAKLVKYVRRICANFGYGFALLIFVNYFFIKGAVYVLVQGVQLPFYKGMGVDGVQYQTFTVIALAPWAMKGIMGTVSDSFALGGYHKRYYMVIASGLGLAAALALSFTPVASLQKTAFVPPLLFFLIMSEVATLDLLIEGKYTEKMRDRPEANADLVTFVWASITLGSLAASTVLGPVNDRFGPRPVFVLVVPLTVLLLPLLLKGFLPETRTPAELANRLQMAKIRAQGPFFLVAVATAAAALLLAAVSLLGGSAAQSHYAIGASVVMVLLAYRAMPRRLAHCNLYMYLQEALYVGLSGTLDFWYTADRACVPDGPAFDYTYYQTYTQWVGNCASIVGLWLFQTGMSRWNIRRVYWVSTLLRTVASLFDYVIVRRWNTRYLRVSDRAMYLFGDAIIFPITSMLNFMPGVLLTAKLCPRSVEATVYAILAGFSNFGSAAARALGVFFQRAAGVDSQPPHCNFDQLPNLILLCHCLLPLLCVPLTFVLLPAVRLDQPLPLTESERVAMYGEPEAGAPPEAGPPLARNGGPAPAGASTGAPAAPPAAGLLFSAPAKTAPSVAALPESGTPFSVAGAGTPVGAAGGVGVRPTLYGASARGLSAEEVRLLADAPAGAAAGRDLLL